MKFKSSVEIFVMSGTERSDADVVASPEQRVEMLRHERPAVRAALAAMNRQDRRRGIPSRVD